MSSYDNVINVSDSNTAPDNKKLNKMQKSMRHALGNKNRQVQDHAKENLQKTSHVIKK
jgi:hypothetical protein